jgi:uncharacterized protein
MMMDIDLNAQGKQFGSIAINCSTASSSFSRLETPVVSMRNGSGPRILCLGGVHGDEYIGQVFWSELIRQILPAANVASAVAGLRKSPIDDVDLNRILPGDPNGSPTARIAHFIETELIAASDFLIDLHGGTSSNLYLSGPTVTQSDDPERMARLVALLRAFAAPVGYVFGESRGGAGGTLGATRRRGIDRLGSEIGGGGMVTIADLDMMRAGVTRVLIHLGVLSDTVAATLPPPCEPRILRRLSGAEGGYIYTPIAGLFAPRVEVGATLHAGQLLGEIFLPERPQAEPTPIFSPRDGVLMTRRRQGRTLPGDTLLVVAEPFGATSASSQPN